MNITDLSLKLQIWELLPRRCIWYFVHGVPSSLWY